jgi:cytoplasmic iron level regulating protein YaaA (DUF328/UPF0246 family)
VLIVLSPAKSLDYATPPQTEQATQPEFIAQSERLIKALRKLKPDAVGHLMSISPKLAQLNVARYQAWSPAFTPQNAKQAVLAFNGDVYDGLNARTLTPKQLEFAQQHLRILSGLYGVLKPLDLMQPYRLEMGTRLGVAKSKDLYGYWGETVTQRLNALLAEEKKPVLVNLASEEYFKVVRTAMLNAPVITPVFEDDKNGRYKIVSFFAKRARGLMARYAIVQRIANPEKLKAFSTDGYAYAPEVSDASRWVFRRKI